MGIDVYLKWKGQTEADEEAQITGCSTRAGNKGYLREAYHGGPYATKVLCPEAWVDQGDGGVPLSAAELKKRLPRVVLTALLRDAVVYGSGNDPTSHTMKPGESIATALAPLLNRAFGKASKFQPEDPEADADPVVVEAVQAQMALYAKHGWLPPFAQSYVDFVALAEQKERETGEACRVYVSY